MNNTLPIPRQKHWPKSIVSVDVCGQSDHLVIEHNGCASWADIQAIKNELWGAMATAIELYPPAGKAVNGGSKQFHYRHLWKLPTWMPWPDIGREGE